ncbi:MAG TPA: pyridoxamine 5'-phosphate oxidase family protein [Polyangia bacterium]|nr:pyridoxamine 5'-phosphate oxidase family protein [Polyangia bacterium]
MADDKAEKSAAAARALLAAESVGILSTISVRLPGTPYGSVTPYALDASGAPLLWLSALAAHTHNLRADPRAGLFIGDKTAAADPQAGARLSLMGHLTRLPEADAPDAQARYLVRHPQTIPLPDFTFWRFVTTEARFIAGFGDIRWLSASALNAR